MRYSNKTKIFTILAITAGMIIAASALAAADLSFSLSGGTTYKVGDTFTANIVVSPTEKIYTVKAQINYPANLLKVESFTFNSNWMPLSQPGYDTIDNGAGLLIKTAGYPGGVSTQVILGTATFKVLNSGETIIKFTSDSLVLNGNNVNVAQALASLDLNLTPVSVPELPEEEVLPEEGVPSEEVTPEEEIVPSEEEVVTPPEEKIPEVSLASLLLASIDVIKESAWMMIIVIISLLGLVVIGIRELARRRKKE